MIRRFLTIAAMLLSVYTGTVSAAGKKISGYLDPEGIEYSIITAGAWKQAASELDAALNNMLWQGIDREEDRIFILREISLLRMIRDISGVEHAEGCGLSSAELSNGYINHRVFLALEPEKPGLLNELPGKNRIKSAEFFSKLPRNTIFAAAMDVDMTVLPEIFRQSGGAGEKFFRQWHLLLETFSKASGIWEVTVVSKDAANKELFWRISAPDDNGELTVLASNLGKKLETAEATVTVTTPFGVLISKDKRVTFYTSKEAVKAFIPAAKDINTQGLPEEAAAVCYFDPTALKLNYPAKISGVVIQTALAEKPVTAALKRTPDGLLTVFNSDRTFLSIGINHILQYFAWLSTVKLPSEVMAEMKKKGTYGKVVKTFDGDPAGKKELDCTCETDLKYVYEELKESGFPAGCYRISKAMKVEKVPNKDCEMVCFGKIKSEKDVPVLLGKGHDDGFCVLLSSGTVKRFTLKKANSWRRIIGFLHTVYMYEEKVFHYLIDLAAQWDKEK